MKRASRELGSVLCAVLVATSLVGCKGKDKEQDKDKETPPPATKLDAGATKPPEPPKAKTPEELAALFKDCWVQWNARAWERLGACYAEQAESETPGTPRTSGRAAIVESAKQTMAPWPDINGELQLVAVSGKFVFAVTLIRGTHTAPFQLTDAALPASNKKFGYLVAQLVEIDDHGQIAKEWSFGDTGTLMGQIGANPQPHRAALAEGWAEKPTVIAKNDAAEQANLAAFAQGVEAFNKHDSKALLALASDDLVWSELAMPADLDKAARGKDIASLWKGFSDARITPALTFAAGDYVVAVATLTGTNDGVVKEMGLNKTGRKIELASLELDRYAAGKVTRTWLFFDGGQLAMQLAAPPKSASTPAIKPSGK